MARKFLKKINVTYKFKLEVLKQDELKDITQDEKEELWVGYLGILVSLNKISRYQARTWTYPSVLK